MKKITPLIEDLSNLPKNLVEREAIKCGLIKIAAKLKMFETHFIFINMKDINSMANAMPSFVKVLP